MAKNLTELEFTLKILEDKKQEKLTLLRNDVDLFQESIKPGALIKTGLKDLFASPGTQGFLMSSAAGIASSMLLGGKAGMIKSVLSQLVTSEPVQNFIKEDKAGIGKWIDKIKSALSRKDEETH
ncbi:MAG: hypothetical protein V4658_04450 [Bacteroidota bacterium]